MGRQFQLDPVTFFISEVLYRDLETRDAFLVSPTTLSRHLRDPSLCLVLLAHGSQDPRWRAPLETLLLTLQKEFDPQCLQLAYMEFHSPTLLQVACECVEAGFRHLLVLPLFIDARALLSRDVPQQVAEVITQLPQLSISVLPPLGEDLRLLHFIRGNERQTGEESEEAGRA